MKEQQLGPLMFLFFLGITLTAVGMLYKYQEFSSGDITQGAFIYYICIAVITVGLLVFGVGSYAVKALNKEDENDKNDKHD